MTKKRYTMKELPESEKPYEKCLHQGVSSLSDAELLAVIIKNGTRDKTSKELAIEVLTLNPAYQGLLGLHHLTMKDLTDIHGIGTVKAIQLQCVLELSKRLAKSSRQEGVFLTGPDCTASYFMQEMRNLETEHFYAAYLDASGRLLRRELIFKGTIQSSMANPREILRQALVTDASHFIVLHNHPSGDPTPSPEDVDSTKRIRKAGEIVGVPLMDHIIIGDNKYVSLRERGFI